MEKRQHYFVSRKNVLTWLMALCMVASAVARIVFPGVKGSGEALNVWSQIVLPIAATTLYALIALFDGEEKHLNLRQFDDKTKRKVYQKQQGICAVCGKHFEITEMEADHIDPWHAGGKTVIDNCQMLCKHCNRRKSGK